MEIRNNWTKEEILEIYNQPLLELVFSAAQVHRAHHNPREVQMSTLISIKTGGCPEDCSYCPQAARYHTNVDTHKLMEVDQVVDAAKKAKESGSSRLCMGAAWRNVRDNRDFDKVLDMVRQVNELDMEVCCTLGMITEEQAKRLEAAGLYAYNHNVDTSEDYYDDIISTRTYKDRLDTLSNVRKTGITMCSGGIIGMGEKEEDRIGMLLTLANLPQHPESVPINSLVPVAGTPLENQQTASIWDMVRMRATARIVRPASVIRLSAGRTEMSAEGQALCFMAGAGSVFAGDKLLTTPNPEFNEDLAMFQTLGLIPTKPFAKGDKPELKPDPGQSFEQRVKERNTGAEV
jgi:biotin synthase